MITLDKLELKNFLSHADTEIDFHRYNGLVLIEGKSSDGHYSSNGAGKSTILEGIVYALTGDTLRGVGVNDVVNRNAKKNTRVSLTFSKDEIEYVVTRYRKDDSMGDSLVLMKGEENISKRVNKETQKLLDDILGVSYKVLSSTVLLGEGLSSRFTQLSDPDKKSLIESTLNLNYDLSKVREKSNTELKSLRLEDSKLDGEITVLESYSCQDIEQLEDSIYDTRECIKLYEETSEHIKEEYERISSEIESINPKLKIITDTIHKYDTLSKSYTELMQSNDHYQEERDRVASGNTPICKLCHQALQSAESKSAVLDSYDDSIRENHKKMSEITVELGNLPNRQLLEDKSAELSAAYTMKSSRSRDLMQDYNTYQIKIAEANKDIESARKALAESSDCSDKLEKRKRDKSSVSKKMKKYDYFYKLFSPTGIIVNILSDAVDYINTRLSVYSEVLLEKDYHINFVKGKISLVDSRGSSYQSLSNGEKRRLDISIQFALHDYIHMYCGMKLDCCFIDEILDTLDDIGVDNIFDVLRLKIEYCQLKSVYVITHNNSLKDKFDRVITVEKDSNGNSHIA